MVGREQFGVGRDATSTKQRMSRKFGKKQARCSHKEEQRRRTNPDSDGPGQEVAGRTNASRVSALSRVSSADEPLLTVTALVRRLL